MSAKVIGVRRWVAMTVLSAALVAGAVFGIYAVNLPGHNVFGAPKVAVKSPANLNPVSIGSFSNGFSAVVKPALPAVVNISSSKIVKNPMGDEGQQQFFNDPFFRQFFGDQFGHQFQQQPKTEREHSLGSGVIVSEDGYLLTNNHVVDGATDIKVSLNDRREFTAKVVGTDAKSDIAVLKINATNLPVLALGDSTKVSVGDVVFAIGDPFGIGETATMGIVSATNRGFGQQIEDYEDFIQTDAAINHGNSGGALIDLHGDLVGINTAILPGNGGGNQGIGFAIPINMAHAVMDQLIAHGKVIRGYLGVYIQNMTPELAQSFGLSNPNGALIGDVTPGGPGSKAGLQKGDVVTELNGKKIEQANELRLAISQTAPGTTVQLQVLRNGQPRNVSVTLAELPKDQLNNEESGSSNGDQNQGLEGVQVESLTPAIAQQLQLPAGTTGVVISSVDQGSVAAESGLDRGDVIQEVNHKPVNSVKEFQQAISANKGNVVLLVNRAGITHYVAIEGH
jgi:serine protease Do